MNDAKRHLDAIKDIRQMMEKSSRFISLSGWSGIAAGICALVGAWFAYPLVNIPRSGAYGEAGVEQPASHVNYLYFNDLVNNRLFIIAAVTLIAAFLLAFAFTYVRSKKSSIPVWGTAARRLMFSVGFPMVVGGIYLLRLIQTGTFGLIAPGCLIFYGLGLINASKYTLTEIRYLGYSQVILGLINCWFIGYGLFFWAFGFGILHIVYGALMWWRYELKNENS